MTHSTDRNAQAALVRAAASFVRDTYSGEWADDAAATLETDADLIERGEPCSLLRLAETMQPAAVSAAVPPPTQTAPRDRIAEALMQWAESNNSPQYGAMRRPATVVQNAYSRADAVLAVLPPTTDQAAVLRWAADHIEDHELLPTRDLKFVRGVDWTLNVLRRMADETATETPAAEPTAEDIARAHVTSLHLIGEQLSTIESWFWEHLADVRDAGARQDGTET
ncbi:hypothetical protein ACWGKO_16330 [Streptomyces griseoincarnatus]